MKPEEIVVGGCYANDSGIVCEVLSERMRQAGTRFAHRCVEYRMVAELSWPPPDDSLHVVTAKVFAAWAKERVS